MNINWLKIGGLVLQMTGMVLIGAANTKDNHQLITKLVESHFNK